MNKQSFLMCPIVAFIVSALSAYLMGCFGKKRGGGVGIWITLLVCSRLIVQERFLFIIVLCVGLTAFLKDWFNLPKIVRLLVYSVFAIAAVFIFLGRPHSNFDVVISLLFILFIIVTAHIYNFMDGINGIAGLTGVIAFLLVGFFAYVNVRDVYVAFMSISIAAACAGFLLFNMPQAKVFMGDVGSVLLGFIFAFFTMLLAHTLVDFICLISFLFPFYADGIITLFVRLKNKENIFLAHRKHIYQLLADEKKIPHWKVSVGFGVVQLAVGVSMMYGKSFGIMSSILLLMMWFIGFAVASSIIRKSISS